jgi:hypothetical protein
VQNRTGVFFCKTKNLADNETSRHPVILSGVELLRVERKRTSKSARLFSRSGISERILVAFEAM